MEKLDDLHYSFRTIDGYNKTFNFVISEREPGKSTALWVRKIYANFKIGKPSIIIKRLINDITDVYINDIQVILNKFVDEGLKIQYKKGSLKEGIVDLKIDNRPFVRVIALSNPISRIKSLILRNIYCIAFDEFICNMKLGEKYLPNEAFKFKELVNTFQRETNNLKVYFLGNPYSLYNPYFIEFGIDTKDLINKETGTLKKGYIYKNKNCVVECYEMKKELRALILKRNPLYQFDDSYSKYAREGININDLNIPLGNLEQNYCLYCVFKVGERYIAIYQDTTFTREFSFFCSFIDKIGSRRTAYCFDFNDIVSHAVLLNRTDKQRFSRFVDCLRRRRVYFSSYEVYYLIEEIYIQL